MVDLQEDEVFLVSSDTESDFGDENHLFYDDEADTKWEIKKALEAFDKDNTGLTDIYQNRFLPRLTDKSHNFIKWLIWMDLLAAEINCPNSKNDPKCATNMEYVLAIGVCDLYQLRCKNCSHKESIRKSSIFYGLRCNLRTVIRIFYGWIKGEHLDVMSNLVGIDKQTVGKIYNRAAKIAIGCICLCPGIADVGGEGVLVVIDIYPYFNDEGSRRKKKSRPILCICEIESIPQKYWLEPLYHWNSEDLEDVKKVKEKILQVIFTVVKRGSTLLLPNKSTLSFFDCIPRLYQHYPSIKSMDDLSSINGAERSLSNILDIIWKTPMAICEQAQFFNPDYVSQFLVRQIWNKMNENHEFNDRDSFIMLISFIVFETRRKNIEKYF